MPPLPDPRRYPARAADDPVALLVHASVRGDREARLALSRWLQERLETQRDDEVFRVLRQAPSRAAYSAVWDLVCRAIDERDAQDRGGLVARLFAFPIVLVTAAKKLARVPGVLPDMDEIRALLERHGAVGAMRNFSLGNALCSADTLEGIQPSLVYRWTREWAGPPRELSPRDIRVPAGRETVHLRFIVGAGIAPRDAPTVVETASNIGAWGMRLTHALVRQLAQREVELLAVPRAPVSLLRASHTGRWAELEAALNLFVSNTLRQFRSSVGEPTAIVSAHDSASAGAEVRLSMSSMLDDALLEGFRWPLHPLDDVARIEEIIAELLRDCRVHDMRFIAQVLPQRLGSGRLFLRGDDAPAVSAAH